MPQEKRPPIIYVIPIVIILIIVGVAAYILYNRLTSTTKTQPGDVVDNTFTPFGNIPAHSTTTMVTQGTTTESAQSVYKPKSTLRLLSSTPVGGYGASTTASTTIVRWVDRGRGNIYEARYNNENVFTISNTLVQKIYNSLWNKDLTAFIAPTIQSGASEAQTMYVILKARITTTLGTTTTSSTTPTSTTGTSFVAQTPYELRGSNLPDHIISYAISPKRDRVFFLVNEGGYGVGYTASFDGKSVTKIFSSPISQLNAEWPEDNTIALTTKGSATYAGFLYFVNPKTGAWKKVIGPILGLSTRVSHDAKYVLASSAESDSVSTAIYNISTQKYTGAVIRTLADKCVWGNFNISMVYCATPSEPVPGLYPDDWYRGIISTVDKIWQLSATSGEVHLVSSITDQSDRVIDAFNLGLDPKDEFLFFMNKNDLSLWSLDLVVGN
ncbi:MAG: hypothetical protein WCP09_00520 [Candidatus Taylorbacteria bacterium]